MRLSVRFCAPLALALPLSFAAGGLIAAGGQSQSSPGKFAGSAALVRTPMPAGAAIRPQTIGSGTSRLASRSSPAVARSPKQAVREPVSPNRLLDDLFDRLAKSTDAEESEGIAGAIQRVWLRSGSDTAELLLSRAVAAMASKDLKLAETLLDRLIAIEPDWAEAWNKRATVRFELNDDQGAMRDIAQVLVREPRHFGALTGMGFILQRDGMDKAALKVFRKVLELYPKLDIIRKTVDKLTVDVEGRDI
jgi:tetratricopeptide (TPR) repeat protein